MPSGAWRLHLQAEGQPPCLFPTRWSPYAMIPTIERILEDEARLNMRRWATFAAVNLAAVALVALMMV